MKILVISHQLPYPLNEGANLRTFYLIRELSKNHDIYLATFIEKNNSKHLSKINQYCKSIRTIKKKRSFPLKCLQLFLSPLVRDPYIVKINYSKKMQDVVDELSLKVDVIQAEFLYMGQYIKQNIRKKILDEHNIESEIIEKQYEIEKNFIKKFFLYFQVKKIKIFERNICKLMDIIITTSSVDKQKLIEFNKNIFVVPNGIFKVQRKITKGNDKTLLFIGLMRYAANVDAMLYFCTEILPYIKAKVSNIKLVIVGKNPTEKIYGLRKPDISITGEVEDISKYLKCAAVFIAPIRFGSGTRIKILEAMAFGKPIVSTSIGCMGLDVIHGENIYVADKPKTFAKYVCYLLNNENERFRVGKAGHKLVKEKYTWKSIGYSLKAIYDDAN